MLENRKKIAKFLKKAITYRSTFLYASTYIGTVYKNWRDIPNYASVRRFIYLGGNFSFFLTFSIKGDGHAFFFDAWVLYREHLHIGSLKAMTNEKIGGVGALDTRYMYEAAVIGFLLPFLGGRHLVSWSTKHFSNRRANIIVFTANNSRCC